MLNTKQKNTKTGSSTFQKNSIGFDKKHDDLKIDTSEITELTEEDWKNSTTGLYYRPNYKIREISS